MQGFMKKMVFEQRVINWVSEEHIPGREKKGTKQVAKPEKSILIGVQGLCQEE